jgi:hypothetical protein
VPPDALAQCEMGQHNREPRLTKNRTKSLKRIRHLNPAAMNGQWTSVSQMSQSYVTGEAWHSGDHMDFPHLIDFGVVGLLAFLLLLGVKTAYDFRDQGRSAARKIQRIATTIAIATIAGQSFFGAFC